MLLLAALAALAPLADTAVVRRPATDTVPPAVVLTLPEAERRAALAPADTDTVQAPAPRRRKVVPVVEYSDAYTSRLNWHRWLSYPIVPLFAAQWYLGNRLIQNQQDAAWVRNGHRAVATATAGIYTVNTVTGLMNLWEGRNDPSGRVKKWVHALSFAVADAGFVYGAYLAKDAQLYGQTYRDRHRTVELTSMGISVASWAMMLFLKDGPCRSSRR